MAAGRFTVSGRKRRRKCQRGVLCGIYDRFVGVGNAENKVYDRAEQGFIWRRIMM